MKEGLYGNFARCRRAPSLETKAMTKLYKILQGWESKKEADNFNDDHSSYKNAQKTRCVLCVRKEKAKGKIW